MNFKFKFAGSAPREIPMPRQASSRCLWIRMRWTKLDLYIDDMVMDGVTIKT